jgi:AcrR family transcriptional regulator
VAESALNEPQGETGREGGGRREAILDAATSLFSEHGFNDADTQALAERLGVGKGTLYRCFASKRELFLAAVDRAMRQLRERLQRSTEEVEDPLDRVANGVRTYLDFFAEHPEFVELLIQERALFKDRKKPTFFEYRERQADLWRGLYAELIAAGRVRAMSVDRIREVMGQLLYGTVFTNYFSGQEKTPEVQAREIVDVVFHGILSDSERRLRPPEPAPADPTPLPPRPTGDLSRRPPTARE